MRSKKTNSYGYSFLEICIVLTVMGLLIGLIITSRGLIHTYELRSVNSQREKYVSAAENFRSKYKYLPGDIPNATSFWGIAAGATGNDATCRNATASYNIKTCNGNGNGRIESNLQWPGGMELLRIWQHLANAEMIDGRYTGRLTSPGDTRDTTNSPSAKIPNAIWEIYWFGSQTSRPCCFDGEYGNAVWLSASPDTFGSAATPVLNNPDLFYIDSKYDDGLPAQGTIVVYVVTGYTLADCTLDSAPVTNTSFNATYDLSKTEPTCIQFYRDVF